MQFVVDASVAVKWILSDEEREPDVSKALAVLQEIQSGEVQILQPPPSPIKKSRLRTPGP